jgi:hypothetical protein
MSKYPCFPINVASSATGEDMGFAYLEEKCNKFARLF